MQHIILILILAVCTFFVGRRFYRMLTSAKDNSACGCSSGCSNCTLQNKKSSSPCSPTHTFHEQDPDGNSAK